MEQHMDALEKANVIRLGKAKIKREVRAGTRKVSDILRDLPEVLKTTRPEELLCSISHFQSRVAQGMVIDIEASQTKRLGEMTPRQMKELTAMMLDWEETQAKRAARDPRQKAAA